MPDHLAEFLGERFSGVDPAFAGEQLNDKIGLTLVEAEKLVEVGELVPDDVHLPGVFVQRVVELTAEQATRKDIEKRTTRERVH